MEVLESLVDISELNMNVLRSAKSHKIVYFHYDDVFDAFTLMLVPPDEKTVVHYLDDHVGLLYKPETMEVVGFQIEAFEHNFIPEHENVGKVWTMDFADNDEKDFGKIVFQVFSAVFVVPSE